MSKRTFAHKLPRSAERPAQRGPTIASGSTSHRLHVDCDAAHVAHRRLENVWGTEVGCMAEPRRRIRLESEFELTSLSLASTGNETTAEREVPQSPISPPKQKKGLAFALVFLSLCVASFLSALDLVSR